MKSYLLILISVIFIIPFSGCKKKSFDPTGKSREDFIGTWKGTITTFKNNQLLKEDGVVMIYPDAGNTTLSGTLFMKETSVFHEFQFVDGTLYFKIVNNNPNSPFCQNWSLGGYAVFPEDGKIDIHISGNECGEVGNEYVNWVGTMMPAQVSPDSLRYYNFATTGNLWNYKVTLKNGDTCHALKQAGQVSAGFLVTGLTTQSCGWSGQNMAFKWEVSPTRFIIMNDTTLSYKSFTFPINAMPGVTYSTYSNNDTMTVTLLDSNLFITTPAGDFNCGRFRYTEPVYAGSSKVTKTAYLWLNTKYGVIRQEVQNPVDSNDVQVQVLSSKNF